MLAAWCASTGLTPRLEVRTVAIGGFQHEAIYLLLSRSNQPLTPWVLRTLRARKRVGPCPTALSNLPW